MAKKILMPCLSDTMEVGTLIKWHKKIGDKIKEGDILAEIETDKAIQEFESEFNAYLLYINVKEGEKVPINKMIAIIGNKEEDISKYFKKKRIFASPLAKKIAYEKKISLKKIKGSGDYNRIIKKDIESYYKNENINEIYHSNLRKKIAEKLSKSKLTAPHYYLTIEINMKKIIYTKKIINEKYPNIKISFNDLIIKAVSLSLNRHPKLNSSWKKNKIIYHSDINIGIAVSISDGLLVPVIFNADKKSLSCISYETKKKIEKAKLRKLTYSEMEGSTFSISNLGMFGIECFTSIINPPNSCILSIGSILKKPIINNDNIIPGYVIKITLACDHRIIDGVIGSKFLKTLKEILENPIFMLL
jgi:pyruvate dehydrogenase E2 component (dihydrolipoamide acetyltransferase)